MIRQLLCVLVCVVCLSAFNEDDGVNEALNAVEAGQYAQARDLYLVLYEESGKLEYLRESILVSALLEDPQATIRLVQAYHQKSKEYDLEVEKVLADSYLKLGDVQNSIITIEKIKKKENSPLVQEILGGLYLQSNRTKDALSELNKAYSANHSEGSLQKLISIYTTMENFTRIGELLNTHLEKYGCSQELCKRSIEFYIKTKQISKVEKLLKQMEEKSPTIQNATNLIAVYAYQNKFDEALAVAKKYPLNRSILIELYVGKGDYLNASKQAMLVYEEEKNPEQLAFAQIYQFEALDNQRDVTQLQPIIRHLKQAIEEISKGGGAKSSNFAGFLNFLGYLLIDNDLSIQEGMGYVERALQIDPNNDEYLDSLAWGYYKLQECQKASEVFAKIKPQRIQTTKELQDHLEAIKKCEKQ